MDTSAENKTDPPLKMPGCQSELCVYESVGIGAGAVAFAVFIALLGYILHLKERRKKDKLAAEKLDATTDAEGNDYASLRRMYRASQSLQTDKDAREKRPSLPSVSEDVYDEINESQIVGLRNLQIRLPLPEFPIQHGDLPPDPGKGYYLTPTSDPTLNGVLRSDTDECGYLTPAYTCRSSEAGRPPEASRPSAHPGPGGFTA